MRDPAFQAIETTYNDYRFRSRLEARWAVFWDDLKEPYQYETQGWRVNGRSYLPDFWLPRQGCWFEVKPEMPDAGYLRMLSALSRNSGSSAVVSVTYDFAPVSAYAIDDEGNPIERTGNWIMVPCHDGDYWRLDGWAQCTSGYTRRDLDLCEYVGIPELPSFAEHLQRVHPGTEWSWSTDTARLRDAYRAARQARFEHGERRWPR